MAPIAFPIKLWNVVNSKMGLISWNIDGKSIVVNENGFDTLVSRRHPHFLRTPSLYSLRKSLRWYNFICLDCSLDRFSRYWHPYFSRDREDLLPKVKPGNKRAIQAWLTKTHSARFKYGAGERYSPDLQLSSIAVTARDSGLTSFQTAGQDLESCSESTGFSPCPAVLWTGIREKQKQNHPEPNEFQEVDDVSNTGNSSVRQLVLPLSQTVDPTVSSLPYEDISWSDLSAAEDVHLLPISLIKETDGEEESRTVTLYNIDESCFIYPEAVTGQSSYESEICSSLVSESTEQQLFSYTLWCEDEIGLIGIPNATPNTLDENVWGEGEIRTYLVL